MPVKAKKKPAKVKDAPRKKPGPKPKPKPLTGIGAHGNRVGRPTLDMGGRPTILTEQISDTICGLMRAGAPLSVASDSVGIARITLREWLKRGAKAIKEKLTDPTELLYADFNTEINKAAAEFNFDLVGTISASAKFDWKAALALLQVRLRKEFGPSIEQRHTGKNGKELPPSQQNTIVITEDRFAKYPLEIQAILLQELENEENPPAIIDARPTNGAKPSIGG